MRSQPEKPVEIWGGIECTINRVGNEFFDQLKNSGHRNRKGDIPLFVDLGLKKMRYPVLWEYHQPRLNCNIDWGETEDVLKTVKACEVDVIAGLVHHGSGPAFVNIADDSFADGLESYASLVAERFPWIGYYTPVNEPLTTARFCGLYGLWYPHERNDHTFCRILINECKGTVLAMAAIRKFNPAAKLVQTEDLAKVHSSPALKYQAAFENERRWVSFDLLCGKINNQHQMWDYLISNGIALKELEFFLTHPCPPDILGINYYLTSERYLDEKTENYPKHTHGTNGIHNYADVEAVRVSEVLPDGLEYLLNDVWTRYQIPIAITEIHLHCTREEQMRWLNEIWLTANRLKSNGVQVMAVTPWALLGSFGWDRLLTSCGGTYEPGVFDISSGAPRPTILAQMIRSYSVNHIFQHPVLDTPGWWQRSCRIIYGERIFHPVNLTKNPLIISGIHAQELGMICRQRCISYVLATESLDNYWAKIEVNENMIVTVEMRPILVVRLIGEADLRNVLNAGLDLFLDEESGYWIMSLNGRLIQQVYERSTVQLAS